MYVSFCETLYIFIVVRVKLSNKKDPIHLHYVKGYFQAYMGIFIKGMRLTGPTYPIMLNSKRISMHKLWSI